MNYACGIEVEMEINFYGEIRNGNPINYE